MKENLSLRKVIVQWVLVRTFGYAVELLEKLAPPGHPKRDHIELLRGVVAALFREIQVIAYPAHRVESPTAKRFNNEWP